MSAVIIEMAAMSMDIIAPEPMPIRMITILIPPRVILMATDTMTHIIIRQQHIPPVIIPRAITIRVIVMKSHTITPLIPPTRTTIGIGKIDRITQ